MTHLANIGPVAAILIAVLLVVGATLTLIGKLGLLMLRNFYQRLHAPTLGASWGTAAVALASMLTFSLLRGEAAIHELAIGIFIMITTPIGLLLLGRAACRRDFGEDQLSAERCAPGVQRPVARQPAPDADQPAAHAKTARPAPLD